MDSFTSTLVILGVSDLFCRFYFRFDEKYVDPDQMLHYVASDLGLHCLSMTLLRVSM